MNDYLESKQPLLKKYYDYLLTDSTSTSTSTSTICVPDKYFNSSLTVLSYGFYKQANGEWEIDSDGC